MVVFLQPAINVLVAVSIMALQLLRELYFGLSLATEMVARLEQPENANGLMVVTELGMLMVVRPLQLLYLYISVYQSLPVSGIFAPSPVF